MNSGNTAGIQSHLKGSKRYVSVHSLEASPVTSKTKASLVLSVKYTNVHRGTVLAHKETFASYSFGNSSKTDVNYHFMVGV